MKSESLVSIIIPTYNSEKTLARCLESIRNQTYKDIEVIVIDNFSTDKTVYIANHFGSKVYLLKSERAKAKNFGTKKAKGEYILFIDSDMELAPQIVEECVVLAKNDDTIGGIIIPERSVGDSFWVKVRDFERSFYARTEIESARFFRKALVKEVNGFDEDIVFLEESTLPQKIERLGYNVKKRIDAKILHFEIDFSLWRWLKKKYYYGKTAFEYKRRYKEPASKQVNLSYRFGLFLKDGRFYSQPLLSIGVLVLKCLEFSSVGLGYLAERMKK